MKRSNILVTGGAGFIGSHVVAYHITKGDNVWAVDNLEAGKITHIAPFQHLSQFRFDQASVQNWPKLEEAVKWADRIYNIAGTVGQRNVLAQPINTLTNNIDSCESILKMMNRVNSKARMITTSTSELYMNAETNPDGAVSEQAILKFESGKFLQGSYPVSKFVNEMMALSYIYEKGLDCVIARLFNTIGINQSGLYGMVVPTFIHQALNSQPLTVFGTGLQTRSFCDARDTVKQLDLLMDNPESKGQIVNVGNDKECSIIDLAHLILKETASHSTIKYLSYAEAYGYKDFVDVMNRRPDLTKLNQLTGYTHQYTLVDTIREILKNLSR